MGNNYRILKPAGKSPLEGVKFYQLKKKRMKHKQPKPDVVSLTGKCVRCGKKEVLTSQQILDAEATGAAISTCCYMPMTIEKVNIKVGK